MSDTPFDPDEAATAAEHMLREVAPHELANTPVYVIHKATLPASRGRDLHDFAGWSGPTLDLALRSVIGSRWRGRGPCVVASGNNWPAFAAVVIHEFAHRMEDADLTGSARRSGGFDLTAPAIAEATDDAASAQLVEWAAQEANGSTYPAALLALLHPPLWVRLTLHMSARAFTLGLARIRIVDALMYEWLLPQAAALHRSLREELYSHYGRPLAELRSRPEPAQFRQLWSLAAASVVGQPLLSRLTVIAP